MPYKLNRKLADLVPYEPIKGDYKIRLDANESFINVNDILSKEISGEISKLSLNRYPDPYAVDATNAFADFYEIPAEYVTAGNGSDELISVITSCFLEKNDEILTFSPDFSMYAFYASMYEVKVTTISKGNDFKIDVDEAIKYCNDNNVKAVLFSNPCNPTSVGLTADEVRKFIKSVRSLVVLDEAYMDFWNESLLTEKDISENDNMIILKTCSKAIGLAGVRLGFAVAGATVTKALKAAKSPYNTDSISQIIGKCIFSHKDLIKSNIAKIKKLTYEIYNSILELSEKYDIIEEVYETVTNFVFIKTTKSSEIYKRLLERGIAIRNLGGFLRITAGNKDENRELLKAMEEVIKDLEG